MLHYVRYNWFCYVIFVGEIFVIFLFNEIVEEFSVNTARDFAQEKGCDMVVLHFGALCCILQLWGVHCKIFTFNFFF